METTAKGVCDDAFLEGRVGGREERCQMNSVTVFSFTLSVLKDSSLGLQTSQAERERSVSIILVPKCSGVSLTSVLGQGVNPEGSPLLQPLLMHFA